VLDLGLVGLVLLVGNIFFMSIVGGFVLSMRQDRLQMQRAVKDSRALLAQLNKRRMGR
jgi:hypothetical protein